VQCGVARTFLRELKLAKSFGSLFTFLPTRAKPKIFCGAARQAQTFGKVPTPVLPIASMKKQQVEYL
tara:strand:- start:2007 stop:2207 length:201 start_codon:yes stop_codon:yes gene_type:complete